MREFARLVALDLQALDQKIADTGRAQQANAGGNRRRCRQLHVPCSCRTEGGEGRAAYSYPPTRTRHGRIEAAQLRT